MIIDKKIAALAVTETFVCTENLNQMNIGGRKPMNSSPNELNVTTFSVVKTDSKLKIKNV